MAKGWILGSALVLTMLAGTALAQQSVQSEVNNLERRVSELESSFDDLAPAGFLLFLFGAFCALWAQNSGRNAWLWFFLGGIFHFITVLVLLKKNSTDRKARGTSGPPS